MKNLKDICNVNIPNSLHSLLEASVLDIDGTLDAGDVYASAAKAWDLLINCKRPATCKKIWNVDYKIMIKSPALAEYLCQNMPRKHGNTKLEYVQIEFNLDDVLFSKVHTVTLSVASEYRIEVQARRIQYDNGQTPSDSMSIPEAKKTILKWIKDSKYLQNLASVKAEFEKNMKEIKYYI